MSKTESFESVMDTLLNGFTHDVRTDELSGLYKMIAARLDRLKAAHDREIRDTAQQQYDRGFHDGQHSMDAEHRAISMRLRGLRFNGGSHENLARIAYAIYPCATGWTCESADGLRDKLIDLMGGVSDENVHVGGLRCDDGCMGDVSNGEDTGRTHDSPSNLDRNHMAVREGVDTVIGDSDDTCCCAGGGACDAAGCDCAGEQEVSDGGSENVCAGDVSRSSFNGRDCLCRNTDCGVSQAAEVGRNDERGDDCEGRDSGEQTEVSDGRVADDCGADTCCGCCGGDLHLDGLDEERRRVVAELRRLDADKEKAYICGSDIAHAIGLDYGDTFLGRLADLIGGDRPSMVTYDVLGNERHKAVCELRSMHLDTGSAVKKLAIALGVKWNSDNAERSVTLLQKRLIHLLGGDQPSGIDMLRAMDEREAEGRITDELREWASANTVKDMVLTTYPAQHGVHGILEQLIAIADRIDEQFGRICQQHENVLQSTIEHMVDENLTVKDERDHWKRLADVNAKALLRMGGENASLKAECEKLEKQRDETNGENKGLRLSIDEQKESITQRKKTIKKLTRDNEKVRKTLHELQAKLDEYDRTHVELPKDANGEVFRAGCTVRMVERHPEVLLTVHSMTLRDDGEWLLLAWDDKDKYSCNLSASEFEVCEKPQDTAESIVRDLSIGAVTEAEAIERIEALND